MANEPLTVETDFNDNRTLITLRGPLLLSNLFDFQTAVRANAKRVLIVDLSGVPYVDSAGLGALLGAKISSDGKGQEFKLLGTNDRVRGTLQMTQVDRFFHYCNSLSEAESAAA